MSRSKHSTPARKSEQENSAPQQPASEQPVPLHIIQPLERPSGAQRPSPEKVRELAKLPWREHSARWKERRRHLQAILDAPPRTITRWGRTMEVGISANGRRRIINEITHLDFQIEDWEASHLRVEAYAAGATEQAQGASHATPAPAAASPKRRSHEKNLLDKQREKVIREVSASGLRGLEYCRAVDHRGVVLPLDWIAEGCPRRYERAYQAGRKWQQRIWDEKYRLSGDR